MNWTALKFYRLSAWFRRSWERRKICSYKILWYQLLLVPNNLLTLYMEKHMQVKNLTAFQTALVHHHVQGLCSDYNFMSLKSPSRVDENRAWKLRTCQAPMAMNQIKPFCWQVKIDAEGVKSNRRWNESDSIKKLISKGWQVYLN